MTPDEFVALAHDVERLYRLRQAHHRPMGGYKVGKNWALATPEEAHAHHVLKALEGADVKDVRAPMFDRSVLKSLRRRDHVAMLGLLYPAHVRNLIEARAMEHRAFVERVEINSRPRDDEDSVSASQVVSRVIYCVIGARLLPNTRAMVRFVEKAVEDHAAGRPIARFPDPEPIPADVAKTHAYLVKLSGRLHEWQEARVLGDVETRLRADADNAKFDEDRAREWVAVAEENGDAERLADLA